MHDLHFKNKLVDFSRLHNDRSPSLMTSQFQHHHCDPLIQLVQTTKKTQCTSALTRPPHFLQFSRKRPKGGVRISDFPWCALFPFVVRDLNPMFSSPLSSRIMTTSVRVFSNCRVPTTCGRTLFQSVLICFFNAVLFFRIPSDEPGKQSEWRNEAGGGEAGRYRLFWCTVVSKIGSFFQTRLALRGTRLRRANDYYGGK